MRWRMLVVLLSSPLDVAFCFASEPLGVTENAMLQRATDRPVPAAPLHGDEVRRDFTCSEFHDVNTSTHVKSRSKLVSVLVAAYDSRAESLERIMEAIWNQTYRELEIIVSIDASPKAAESGVILERFQLRHPGARVQLHRQRSRLHWAANVNFFVVHVER